MFICKFDKKLKPNLLQTKKSPHLALPVVFWYFRIVWIVAPNLVFVLEKYRRSLSLRHKFRLLLHGDFVCLKIPQQLKIIISAIAIYQKIISIFHPYDEIFTQ
jgi:hypothetical protein